MPAPVQARRLALICGALLAATPSYAKPLPEALRDARARTHAPAATAAVYHCGRRVWSGASGAKSLRSRQPVRADTPFILASVTKTVTATMVLQLVEDGRLSLDGLIHGRLTSAKTLDTMTSMGRFRYGLGIYPWRYRGRRWVGHDGSHAGYEGEVWHDAGRDVTIAVLTNREDTASRVWRAIASAYRVLPCS